MRQLNINQYFYVIAIIAAIVLVYSHGTTSEEKEKLAEEGDNLTKIIDTALLAYDRRVRPFLGEQPVTVLVRVGIVRVNKISEIDMEYTLDLTIEQSWSDPRLNISLGGRMHVMLEDEDAKRIWLPDTQFLNEQRKAERENNFKYIAESGGQAALTPNGCVMHITRITLTAFCPINVRLFPHDSQKCELIMGSGLFSMADIILSKGSTMEVFPFQMAQHEIIGHDARQDVIPNPFGNFSRLIFEIRLRRKIGYFIVNLYFPTSALVCLSWLAFWIPKSAIPQRFTVGFSTILNMVIIKSGVTAQLPKVSYIKAVDLYLATCFLFVCAALCESVLVGYVNRHNNTSNYGSNSNFRPSIDEGNHENGKLLIVPEQKGWRKMKAKNVSKLDVCSRVAFPIVFAVFMTMFLLLVTHLSAKDAEQ